MSGERNELFAVTSPRICLLCVSMIKDDPRVRKQGNLLHHAGFSVAAVGFSGGTAPDPDWPIRGVPRPASASVLGRVRKLFIQPRRYAEYFFCKALQPIARWSETVARQVYWRQYIYQRLFETARGIFADIYVANDWDTLPIASRLARIHGALFVYDTHEYAAEELPESLRWRIFRKALATTVERMHIHQAAMVSTVSSGIARHLQRDYGLREMPFVMRNVPEEQHRHHNVSPLRRGNDLTLLFHGAITEPRALHVLIASVRYWRSDRHLVLRGPISETYRRRLAKIVRQHGLENRVAILPPISANRLIDAAAEADLGVVCLPDTSLENRFALPNKVFEYIRAGLALLVPRLDELVAIVERYDNGIIFPRLHPEVIAEVVNRLDIAAVNALKMNSRAAAAELSWEREAASWKDRLAYLAASRR
jgi:glycogen(starch) synthase